MSKIFQTISPVDNSVYVERAFGEPKEIEVILQKAESARKVWQSLDLDDRRKICSNAIDWLVARASEIGEEISWQMGRPVRYTPFEVKGGLKERADHMIEIAEEALMEVTPASKEGFRRFVKREPLGTVLVLAPWNYPFLTAVNAIIPALLAGNTVILKHAIQTPLVAERFQQAFDAAGIPEGVFQILHLTHDQVATVISDSRVSYVAFTGSVGGGEAIQRAIGSRFISAGLELGGKDPAYIRADADLAFSIENVTDGAFFNSGQSCCGIERVYVHETIYDQVVEGIVEDVKKYRLGNPLDREVTLGPMVRQSAATFVRNQIKQAISDGASALIDEQLFPLSNPESPYLAPQVLTGVTHEMEIMQEETFGPVVGIMKVRSDEEAVGLMNDSQFGLTASIWTADEEVALHLGNQLETGTVFLNRCDYLDPALAWTGVKNSGKGCTLSPIGFESLTRPKSYHFRLR